MGWLWSIIIDKLIKYLDDRLKYSYDELKKNPSYNKQKFIKEIDYHCLYARSFFKDYKIHENYNESFNYYKKQAALYWQSESPYIKALAAIALSRYEKKEISLKIIESLKDYAVNDKKNGMHFNVERGLSWNNSSIETHAVILEAFHEVANDKDSVSLMKKWLGRHKSRHSWGSTKATSDSIYALLLGEEKELDTSSETKIKINGKYIDLLNDKNEFGFLRKIWAKSEITPELGEITILSSKPATGGVFWSYYNNIDEISQMGSLVSIERKFFISSNDRSKRTEVLPESFIPLGTKLIIHIKITSENDLEYVHISDFRPSGVEPENVLPVTLYKNNKIFLLTTSDTTSDMFFDYMPKGTYEFEIPVIANVSGNFSSGYTKLYPMYSPEYSAHSKGGRIIIGKK